MDFKPFMRSPCQHCEDRHSACHDHCSRFFLYRVARSRAEKRKRYERDANLDIGAKTERAMKEKKHRGGR